MIVLATADLQNILIIKYLQYTLWLGVFRMIVLATADLQNIFIIKHLQTHLVARGVQDDSPSHS